MAEASSAINTKEESTMDVLDKINIVLASDFAEEKAYRVHVKAVAHPVRPRLLQHLRRRGIAALW